MEVDLLKYLILSDKQISLYQVIPKPVYHNSNENKGFKALNM